MALSSLMVRVVIVRFILFEYFRINMVKNLQFQGITSQKQEIHSKIKFRVDKLTNRQ